MQTQLALMDAWSKCALPLSGPQPWRQSGVPPPPPPPPLGNAAWGAGQGSNVLISRTLQAAGLACQPPNPRPYSLPGLSEQRTAKGRILCKNICRETLDAPIGVCSFQQQKGRKCEMFHPPEAILRKAEENVRTNASATDDVWREVQRMYKEQEVVHEAQEQHYGDAPGEMEEALHEVAPDEKVPDEEPLDEEANWFRPLDGLDGLDEDEQRIVQRIVMEKP